MALTDTLSKMASSLLAIAKNRAALASIELQEELGRIIGYVIFSIAAFFCILVGIIMAGVLVVVLCWDTCRVGALGGVTAFFLIIGIILALKLRSSLKNRPKILAKTREEIATDIARLKSSAKPASE
ncbi:MAG: phage holin family protein [Oxalobacter sp.]|nr:phage holin family protein [Oxalobacter sp.]